MGMIENIKLALSPSVNEPIELSYDNSGGSDVADYTVLDDDINVDFNGILLIQIMLNQTTTAQVKLTPAGSSEEYTGYLNSGNNLNANAWYEFGINVGFGDKVNFVIQVPAGAVLSGVLRVFKRER